MASSRRCNVAIGVAPEMLWRDAGYGVFVDAVALIDPSGMEKPA
jgi:hypothetical protein